MRPEKQRNIVAYPERLKREFSLLLNEGFPRFRIVYVGPSWNGCTSMQRVRALVDLGQYVTSIGHSGIKTQSQFFARLYRGFRKRLGYPLEWNGENGAIRAAIQKNEFDLLWIEKGQTITASTLRFVKKQPSVPTIITYYPDDMGNPANQSRYWLKSVPVYDLHVTTKSYNVAELRELGAKNLLFVDKSYDPHTHRPMVLSKHDYDVYGADVCFIGGYEKQRASSLVRLARAGISIRVWGTRWNKLGGPIPSKLRLEYQPIYGDEYAKAICASKINLCYLRKANRDLQTSRSVEIPACRAFMLAERTNEHLRLFREGKEAEYFSSQNELLRKLRYYLESPTLRRRIAQAGYERCLRSGYSNHHRLTAVLNKAAQLRLSRKTRTLHWPSSEE